MPRDTDAFILVFTPPSKTYQKHALARGRSGVWRRRVVQAPVGDAAAPFR